MPISLSSSYLWSRKRVFKNRSQLDAAISSFVLFVIVVDHIWKKCNKNFAIKTLIIKYFKPVRCHQNMSVTYSPVTIFNGKVTSLGRFLKRQILRTVPRPIISESHLMRL
jgi:hypothetical protein